MRSVRNCSLLLCGLLAGAVCGSAWGTPIIYTLDTGNPAVTGTGPYASVTVDAAADGLSANIEFESLTNGGFIYLLGDGGTADLNVNGTYAPIVAGDVSETNTLSTYFSGGSYLSNTPGQVNGFGTFSLSLNNSDGFKDSATSISFILTNTSGTPWTGSADVLTANANGAVAAVHVFACAFPCTTTDPAPVAAFTGFAAGSDTGIPPSEIPEPGVLALLSIGLLGLGLTAARRRS
jgi:hypothetical protein